MSPPGEATENHEPITNSKITPEMELNDWVINAEGHLHSSSSYGWGGPFRLQVAGTSGELAEVVIRGGSEVPTQGLAGTTEGHVSGGALQTEKAPNANHSDSTADGSSHG